MAAIVTRYLTRGRQFFKKDLPPWLQDFAEKLPPYRTPTMVVASDMTLKTFQQFVHLSILTAILSLFILNGTVLGTDVGATFVRIKTQGWAQDSSIDARVYDASDLRFPQVENSAIFVATHIVESPIQLRYETSSQAMRCIGSDDKTEACTSSQDCNFPRHTKHGILTSGTYCLNGYCMVNAWCNSYVRPFFFFFGCFGARTRYCHDVKRNVSKTDTAFCFV